MFANRKGAGISLSKLLKSYKNKKNIVVLGVPRGGVEVAFYISKELNLPLGVFVVKKIGHPLNPELAIGAASVEDYYINEEMVKSERISKDYVSSAIKLKMGEAKSASENFSSSHVDFKDKLVILVDDGAATGSTMLLAVNLVKKKAKEVIVALPVASYDAAEKLRGIADDFICILVSKDLEAIGQYYSDFFPVADKKVKEFLK